MDWLQLLHHISALISLCSALVLGRSAADCVLGLFVAEFANPYLYTRYLLYRMGVDKTWMGIINEVITHNGGKEWMMNE